MYLLRREYAWILLLLGALTTWAATKGEWERALKLGVVLLVCEGVARLMGGDPTGEA